MLMRGRRLRRGAERAQRRLRQRALVQPADAARALRRRGRDRGRPRGAALGRPRSAASAREQGVDAWYRPGRLSAGLDRAGLGRRLASRPRRPARSGRRARRLRRARRGRGPAPLRLADLPRRRLLPRRGDRAAGPPRRGLARPRARARGRGLRADHGQLGRAAQWPRGRRRGRAAGGCARRPRCSPPVERSPQPAGHAPCG